MRSGLETYGLESKVRWGKRLVGTTVGSPTLWISIAPAASIVTPLLVIPVVSRVALEPGLVAISIGQSIGGVVGIVVALSWPLTGTAAVVSSTSEGRVGLLKESLDSRILALVIFAPPSCLISAFTVDGRFAFVASLSTLAFACSGLSFGWYFFGVGRARELWLFEVAPRLAASLLASASLLANGVLEVYPFLILIAVLTNVLLVIKYSLPGERYRISWAAGRAVAVTQVRASAARVVYGLYSAGSTAIVATFAPSAVLVFSSLDRTQKSAFNALISFPEALTRWVMTKEFANGRKTATILILDLAYSSAAGVAFFLLLPLIVSFLYQDLVKIDLYLSIATSTTVALLILNRSLLLHIPIARGQNSFATRVLFVGAIFAAVLLAGGSIVFGADGGITAIGGAELAMAVAAVSGSKRAHGNILRV